MSDAQETCGSCGWGCRPKPNRFSGELQVCCGALELDGLPYPAYETETCSTRVTNPACNYWKPKIAEVLTS